MHVPAGDVRKIIGKGGSMIRELQDSTGSRINIQKDAEGDTTEVELKGSPDSTAKAKTAIEQVLAGSKEYTHCLKTSMWLNICLHLKGISYTPM